MEQLVRCPECGRFVKLSDSANVYDKDGKLICCVCEDCYDSVVMDLTSYDEDEDCE